MKLLIITVMSLHFVLTSKAQIIPEDLTNEKLSQRLTQYISKRTNLSDSNSKKLGFFMIERNKTLKNCRKDSCQDIFICRIKIAEITVRMCKELGKEICDAYKILISCPYIPRF